VDVIVIQLIDDNEQHINVLQHEIIDEPFYVQVNQNIKEIVDLKQKKRKRNELFERKFLILPSLVGNIVSSESVF